MTLAELWEYAVRYNLTDRELVFLYENMYFTVDNVRSYNNEIINLEGECIDEDF